MKYAYLRGFGGFGGINNSVATKVTTAVYLEVWCVVQNATIGTCVQEAYRAGWV